MVRNTAKKSGYKTKAKKPTSTKRNYKKALMKKPKTTPEETATKKTITENIEPPEALKILTSVTSIESRRN